MPTRSAVRKQALCARAVAGPATASTSSTVRPRSMHVVDGVAHGEHADAVGDEVGRVLGVDHALAEPLPDEGGHRGGDGRIGVAARDHLEQPHVARRVEEVGDEEARAQPLGQRVGDLVHREAAGVAGEDGVGAQVRGHLLPEQLLLHRHVLDHHLDDPVAVLAGAGGRPPGCPPRCGRGRRGGRAAAGFCFASASSGAIGSASRVRRLAALLGDDVEEQHPDAGVGQVRRDGRAHDSGAQHRGPVDPRDVAAFAPLGVPPWSCSPAPPAVDFRIAIPCNARTIHDVAASQERNRLYRRRYHARVRADGALPRSGVARDVLRSMRQCRPTRDTRLDGETQLPEHAHWRPVVWAFSTSRLRHVFDSVAPLLADVAEVRVFDRGFEDALETVRELPRRGRARRRARRRRLERRVPARPRRPAGGGRRRLDRRRAQRARPGPPALPPHRGGELHPRGPRRSSRPAASSTSRRSRSSPTSRPRRRARTSPTSPPAASR